MDTKFRNKAEAQRAIDDLEIRADTAEHFSRGETARKHRAEAERIRRLLPTLPD